MPLLEIRFVEHIDLAAGQAKEEWSGFAGRTGTGEPSLW